MVSTYLPIMIFFGLIVLGVGIFGLMNPEEVFGEEGKIITVKISDGISTGDSEPKTNFEILVILK